MLFDELVGKGKLIRPPGSPLIGGKFRVTQDYGCTGVLAEPRLGDCKHFHRGLDINDGGCESPVFVPRAGKVKFAGKLNNNEKVVVINHFNGWGSSYGHLDAIDDDIKDGATVEQGRRIGRIGKSGITDGGCHLHFAVKSGLPAGWDLLDFIPNVFGSGRGDTTGKWRNPWPLLVQNVTIQLRTDLVPIRIRTAPEVGDNIFATTEADGTIHRTADDAVIGPVASPRKWGGHVAGGEYEILGVTGTSWEKIRFGGVFRFIATPLAKVSAR